MNAIAPEPTPVVSDPWDTHPLSRALRCVRCLDPAPLRRKSDGPVPLWICERCNAVYEHWEGMPVVIEKEVIQPEEVYSEAHPVPFRGLRQRNPGVFAWLRRIYHTYARFEAFVAPRTELEPAVHLKRMKRDLPHVATRITLDVGGGAAPYREILDGTGDSWVVLEKDRFHALGIRRKGAKADFLIGGGELIPLQDGCCDLVVLTEVLEHCKRPGDVLKEIARVLRPGGFCIGTVPQYWHVHGWPNDYFRYTRHGLEFLAGEAGLHVSRMNPKGGPILLLWAVVDLTTCRWSRFPLVSLLVRVPTLWFAWILDRLFYPDPCRMRYPDTAGWAFLFEKPRGERVPTGPA
jgi:SAM-dependent methyltransferase